MTSASPRVILARLITEFVGQLPGIRDGHPESVHAARVATRRLREVIPLLAGSHAQEGDAFEALVRSAGRALGRVRELDVMRVHLARLEERFPETAVGVAVARRTLCARQVGARRRLIDSFERLRIERGVARGLPTARDNDDPARSNCCLRQLGGPAARTHRHPRPRRARRRGARQRRVLSESRACDAHRCEEASLQR